MKLFNKSSEFIVTGIKHPNKFYIIKKKEKEKQCVHVCVCAHTGVCKCEHQYTCTQRPEQSASVFYSLLYCLKQGLPLNTEALSFWLIGLQALRTHLSPWCSLPPCWGNRQAGPFLAFTGGPGI